MRIDIIHELEAQNFRLGNACAALRRVIEIPNQIYDRQMKNVRKRVLGMGLIVLHKFGNRIFNELRNFLILHNAFISATIVARDVLQVLRKGFIRAREREEIVIKARVLIGADFVNIAREGKINIPRVDGGFFAVGEYRAAAACYDRELEPVQVRVGRNHFRRLAITPTKLQKVHAPKRQGVFDIMLIQMVAGFRFNHSAHSIAQKGGKVNTMDKYFAKRWLKTRENMKK